MLTLACPAVAECGDYVRLHVVAADDSDAAQALKLEVRDAVLDAARALLDGCADADAAWDVVIAHADDLRKAALRRARERGYAGAVRCEAGVFAFPERWYGGNCVPEGDYRALRVVIGAGEGRNWWCVLYPSLCYPADLPQDEPVRFYSVLLNWLRAWFGGEAA